ncbi:unnamed protein product [Tuwongella immobilis]|uniref:Uncharacterized protein n=1 Tax=Tuwongella immobilis TaxID=692036 RepID=A0A6C2YW85_9BACT|nr:unnamed protein product [Tuwongella immobilis]VTS07794.1 unnamed protein product [Tuwongella immobilis]
MQILASIRPQIFVCGNWEQWSLDEYLEYLRFNSATDFCLWKYQEVDFRCREVQGFNSATDFCLWKYYTYLRFNEEQSKLQFGHRFLSVEMRLRHRHWSVDRRGFNSATDFCLWKSSTGKR